MRKLIVVAILIAASVAAAQTHPSRNHDKDKLRFTLILSRHGVRPPLSANSALNLRSSSAWPEWEVPLGYLTPHGAQAIRQMGAYMRLDLARKGLFPVTGCPDSNKIYLYADTQERTILSTRNTFAGMEPGCDLPPVHIVAASAGIADPIFSPIPDSFPPPSAKAIAADQRATLGNDPDAFFSLAANPGLKKLADILAPDPAHPAAKPILNDPRPLALAPSLIEDFLLEYVDGKPMTEVGWGRVDEPTICRLMPLYVKGFDLVTRTPLAARSRGSNLVAHILDTLEQVAQAAQSAQAQPVKPVSGAFGPVGARLVYIGGHDSDLSRIGGLFNLHWKVGGVTDDTPPDSQLVFELWQNSNSKQYTVHLFYHAQTYDQLRSGQALTLAKPPVEVDLVPPGCRAGQPCSFAAFDQAARSLLDPAYIKPNLLPTQLAPPNP
ncbi:MAG: histidine-type phosphatase [Terracidiphilus sp.]|jgi:4-phytase/acid phosphatase